MRADTRSGIRTHEAYATFYASSGIRTHEAEATDLKSVPFDHSGIDANKQPNTYTSAANFNNACSAHKLQYFVSEDYPLRAVYHLLPRLRLARL